MQRPSARSLFGLLALVPALAGCREDAAGGTESASTSTTDGSGGSSGVTGGEAGPTYWQDVAPVFFSRCVTCHGEGGIGPFRLDTYADAKQWAEVAASAVEQRTMPPWLVTDDGTCGVFADSRAMPQAEIELVRAWVDAGAQEGEPRTDLMPPPPGALAGATVDYTTPEFVPEIQGGQYAMFDEYRCFYFEVGGAADRFITGFDVHPGNAPLIHHVVVSAVDPEAAGDGTPMKNKDVIAALDGASPDRDGWPCFGLAGDGVSVNGVPITWAPGMGVAEFPPDTGYRVKPTDWLVAQVHYNLSDAALIGQSDATTLKVRYADSVKREGYFDLPDRFLDTLFEGNPAQLPPGEASAPFTWEYSFSYLPLLGAQAADLYGVFPHMHQRGRTMLVELIEDGGAPQCAAEVERWDFGWQLYYFYEQPFALTPKTKMRVTCNFDTQGATEPVTPGWGTQNEMCLAGIFVVPK